MSLFATAILAVLGILFCIEGIAADTKCRARSGTCQYDYKSCSGSYVSNLCNGASNRRCCVSRSSGYDDSRCSARRGVCKYTSTTCSGGDYVPRLCGGPSNRRCCVPRGSSSSSGGGSCTAEQKRLACELFRSSNVRAAQEHPSKEKDNAYPYNNLRDVCNGGKASRSSYYCGTKLNCYAPGGSTCLSTNLLKYLVNLANSGTVVINELAGACHSCKSRHYSGLAVDLHKDSRSSEYIRKCREFRGGVEVEKNHIHCQFYDGTHPNW